MSVRAWLVAGAAVIGVGGLVTYGGLALVGPGPLPAARYVIVPHGSSGVVAAALHRSGVVRSVWMFQAASAMSAWQGGVRSGEFAFPAHADLWQVLAVLRLGRPVEHLLTIPEGLTAWRIGEVLAGSRALAGEITLPREGEVLPETYAYQWGTMPQAVLARARRAMDDLVERIWRGREAGLPLRSPRELVILASLVERETHLAAERPLVARVFLNRLKLGMRLQSDPTVVYGESGGRGELPAGLGHESLERVEPYNTYALAGLPAWADLFARVGVSAWGGPSGQQCCAILRGRRYGWACLCRQPGRAREECGAISQPEPVTPSECRRYESGPVMRLARFVRRSKVC